MNVVKDGYLSEFSNDSFTSEAFTNDPTIKNTKRVRNLEENLLKLNINIYFNKTKLEQEIKQS